RASADEYSQEAQMRINDYMAPLETGRNSSNPVKRCCSDDSRAKAAFGRLLLSLVAGAFPGGYVNPGSRRCLLVLPAWMGTKSQEKRYFTKSRRRFYVMVKYRQGEGKTE